MDENRFDSRLLVLWFIPRVVKEECKGWCTWNEDVGGWRWLWFPNTFFVSPGGALRDLTLSSLWGLEVSENREVWKQWAQWFLYSITPAKETTRVLQVFLREPGCSECSYTCPLVHICKSFLRYIPRRRAIRSPGNNLVKLCFKLFSNVL